MFAKTMVSKHDNHCFTLLDICVALKKSLKKFMKISTREINKNAFIKKSRAGQK